MSLTSNEPVGTSARLGVLRLGAGRLAAILPIPQLHAVTGGTYAWKRSDGPGGHVNDGRPPGGNNEDWLLTSDGLPIAASTGELLVVS